MMNCQFGKAPMATAATAKRPAPRNHRLPIIPPIMQNA